MVICVSTLSFWIAVTSLHLSICHAFSLHNGSSFDALASFLDVIASLRLGLGLGLGMAPLVVLDLRRR